MVIKVKGTENNDSWRFYEAHEVQWAEATYEACQKEMKELAEHDCKCEAFGMDDDCESVANEPQHVFARITFFDQNGTPRHVYTNTTAYLLNNEGKTIDRIN